jgi:hypothetical protein
MTLRPILVVRYRTNQRRNSRTANFPRCIYHMTIGILVHTHIKLLFLALLLLIKIINLEANIHSTRRANKERTLWYSKPQQRPAARQFGQHSSTRPTNIGIIAFIDKIASRKNLSLFDSNSSRIIIKNSDQKKYIRQLFGLDFLRKLSPTPLLRSISSKVVTDDAMTDNTNNNSAKRQRMDMNDSTGNDSEPKATEWDSICQKMEQRAQGMNERTKLQHPFTEMEWDDIKQSMDNIMAVDGEQEVSSSDGTKRVKSTMEYHALHTFLFNVGHLSHKDWARTGANGQALGKLLSLENIATSTTAQSMLYRILHDGNWYGAIQHATTMVTTTSENNQNIPSYHPWAVLVTGVK